MNFLSQTAVLDACRTLFGDEVNLGPEFLGYLQPGGAKSAFRTQVKQHHPDRFPGAPPEVRARQTARFREIHQAYHLLASYLDQRGRLRPHGTTAKQPPRPAPSRQHRPSTPATEGHGIPPLPLEFGIFAYYRGRIDYRELIDALVWQRRQRPAIGALACQWGWLNEVKVRGILGHRGSGGRFGRRAVELGLLSSLQVDALLRHQRAHQQRLGKFFVDRGLMTAAEADQLAIDLQRHNARVATGRR
jgi:hypothetical protein